MIRQEGDTFAFFLCGALIPYLSLLAYDVGVVEEETTVYRLSSLRILQISKVHSFIQSLVHSFNALCHRPSVHPSIHTHPSIPIISPFSPYLTYVQDS